MNPVIATIISVILAYLIGSIPTAYIFGRLLKGIDIRKEGSGNMGATNAFRVLGKEAGWAVLALDIIKGILPVVILVNIFGLGDPLSLVLIGIATVCGHNWTVFLQFKGGKGIATSLGVLIGFAIQLAGIRPVLAVTLLSWVVVFLVTGFVSLASIIASIVLPIAMVIVKAPCVMIIMAVLLSIFVVLRHRPNIKRLLENRENRVNLPHLAKKS